ncbi:CO/xanthine dehydrogenase Mo-binding subunit [Bradyrhizobium sp. GM6.1]
MASPHPNGAELQSGSLVVVRTVDECTSETFVRITADGSVTAYNGHVDLGTGIRTALGQIVAEELDVSFARLVVVLGDTATVPNQGATIASETIQITAVPLRKAAAQARHFLIARAAEHLELPAADLRIEDGLVRGHDNRSVSYGELIGGETIRLELADDVAVKPVGDYAIVGQSMPRVDLPAKATGELTFVHDIRVPGMLHGRVVRPPYAGVDAGPFVGTSLISVDESSVRDIPGIMAVVRIGDFVGIVAEREENAIRAAEQLAVSWRPTPDLTDLADVETALRANPSTPRTLIDKGDVDAAIAGAAKPMRRTYVWPYQMHASIGPSCAVADFQDGNIRVWSGTQNPHVLRADLSLLIERPESEIEVIRLEAAGCYGRNCADDVTADALLLSRAVGRPVRVQLTREQEHAWEPKGAAQLIDVNGGLDAAGDVAAYDLATRYPSNAAPTLALLLTGRISPRPDVLQMGDRTAIPPYDYGHMRVVAHDMAPIVRASWFRGVSALPNTFAHESYIDEAATEAGVDPIEYRLRYLKDQRAVDLVHAVAERAGWTPRPVREEKDGEIVHGRGFAYALYVHSKFPGYGAAWSAWVTDVAVNKSTGEVSVTRVVAGQDSGLMINPDGVRHQIHGNVIQSTSRALMEEVSFERGAVAAREWGAYPIIPFPDVPKIDVLLLPAAGPAAARRRRIRLGPECGCDCERDLRCHRRAISRAAVHARAHPEWIAQRRAGHAAGAARSRCATTIPYLGESIRQTRRHLRDGRGRLHRGDWHRCGCFAQPRHRTDRAARPIGLFRSDDRARATTGRTRQLRGVPHHDRRCAQRRWPRAGDAVRHDLRDQHHARRRDRHRRLVLSRIRARDARRAASRRTATLSRLPLHALFEDWRCRHAGALCLSNGTACGARDAAGEYARLPVQSPPATCRMECAVPSDARVQT